MHHLQVKVKYFFQIKKVTMDDASAKSASMTRIL